MWTGSYIYFMHALLTDLCWNCISLSDRQAFWLVVLDKTFQQKATVTSYQAKETLAHTTCTFLIDFLPQTIPYMAIVLANSFSHRVILKLTELSLWRNHYHFLRWLPCICDAAMLSINQYFFKPGCYSIQIKTTIWIPQKGTDPLFSGGNCKIPLTIYFFFLCRAHSRST